jgi:hypothetical protein
MLVCFAASMLGQNPKLPPDIDPQSDSRLPLIQRNQLSDEDKKVFDDVSNTAPRRVSLYSPPLLSGYKANRINWLGFTDRSVSEISS